MPTDMEDWIFGTDVHNCPCFECEELYMNGGECDGSEMNCVERAEYNTYEKIEGEQ